MTNPESTDVALAAFLQVMGVRPIRVHAVLRRTGLAEGLFEFAPCDEFLKLRKLFYSNRTVDVSPFELFQVHKVLLRKIKELKRNLTENV